MSAMIPPVRTTAMVARPLSRRARSSSSPLLTTCTSATGEPDAATTVPASTDRTLPDSRSRASSPGRSSPRLCSAEPALIQRPRTCRSCGSPVITS